MADKLYDVYIKSQEQSKQDIFIGWQVGSDPGGVVSDQDDNVVGCIYQGVVRGEYVLKANQPWHTGQQYDGEVVVWDNRPSKRTNQPG
jgi:hypothetical protein